MTTASRVVSTCTATGLLTQLDFVPIQRCSMVSLASQALPYNTEWYEESGRCR